MVTLALIKPFLSIIIAIRLRMPVVMTKWQSARRRKSWSWSCTGGRSLTTVRECDLSPLRGIFEEKPTLPCMVSACPLTEIARLFGELDGALRQPHGFCRSGIVSGTYRTAQFRGETSGDGPLTWWDRGWQIDRHSVLTWGNEENPGQHHRFGVLYCSRNG